MPTYLRWCYVCEKRSEPLAEPPDDATCTHCGSEDTMVECVDPEDSLLAMDEAHDSDPEFYYSPWLKAEIQRREEEDARRGVGVAEGGEYDGKTTSLDSIPRCQESTRGTGTPRIANSDS